MIVFWSQRKIGSERHCKHEAARGTALSHAPGHGELSSSLSCKFNLCSTVAENHAQEPTNELRQLCLLKYVDDPGMVDAGVGSGKIRQENTRFLWRTCHVRQGRRFNFEDVVRHLSGRDTSLGWMYASHGVPLKASADRRW